MSKLSRDDLKQVNSGNLVIWCRKWVATRTSLHILTTPWHAHSRSDLPLFLSDDASFLFNWIFIFGNTL
jgi:hypothetical protein